MIFVAIGALLYLACAMMLRVVPGIRWSLWGLAVGLALVMYYVLIEFDLGPASARVYITMALGGWMVLHAMIHRQTIFRSPLARRLFMIWVVLAIWIFVNQACLRELNRAFLTYFTSKFVLAMMLFLAMQYFLRRYEDLNFLGVCLIALTAVNAAVAIAQWLDMGWAWKLYETLRPITAAYREEELKIELATSRVGGLCGYSIPLSYLLISFGGLTAGRLFLYEGKRWIFNTAVTLPIVLAAAVALYVSLTRSATYGFLFIVSIGFLFFLMYAKRSGGLKLCAVLLAGAIVFAGIVFVAFYSNMGIYQRMDRLTQFDDTLRIEMAKTALSIYSEHWLVGGGIALFAKEMGFTTIVFWPHNIFLNAMVLYGTLGLALILILLGSIFWMLLKALPTLRLPSKTNWVTLGTFLGMMGYCFNSLFHNDSFVTGGFTGFVLLGLFVASQALETKGTDAMRGK